MTQAEEQRFREAVQVVLDEALKWSMQAADRSVEIQFSGTSTCESPRVTLRVYFQAIDRFTNTRKQATNLQIWDVWRLMQLTTLRSDVERWLAKNHEYLFVDQAPSPCG